MVEDLIVRYRLKDYHLMVLAFFYGTIYCAFTSGIAFINPTLLGIAWLPLVSINIVWWGAVQAVLTFYLANLISPRKWSHEFLSKKGWILCLVVNILAVIVFQKSGVIPLGTPVGRFWILITALISLGTFITLINKKFGFSVFKSSRLMNMLSITTVVLFLFTATFLTDDPVLSNTSNVNSTSLMIISRYTLLLFTVMLGYRIISKKEIPV